MWDYEVGRIGMGGACGMKEQRVVQLRLAALRSEEAVWGKLLYMDAPEVETLNPEP